MRSFRERLGWDAHVDAGPFAGHQLAEAKEGDAHAHRALCRDSEFQATLLVGEALGQQLVGSGFVGLGRDTCDALSRASLVVVVGIVVD